MGTLWLWLGFLVFVLLMLALDLGVFHRRPHEISLREAAIWSAVWVVLALLFNWGLWWYAGARPALEFFTGYLIEKSLSVDNIFVFLMLFNYFGVEPRYQHRVLFWGILGALIMRGAMIALGVALIVTFHWVIYIFGAFLVWTGVKMMTHKPEDIRPEQNPVFRWARKFLPITENYEGQQFFVHRNNIWYATPMFLVLLVVETTDLAFAVDSIPAIFAITKDPFIVFTSNVFAILGLRAFYFLLAGILPYFRYLSAGLSVVLIFIGVKMLLEFLYEIPIGISLGVVGGVLTAAMIASIVAARVEARLLRQLATEPGGPPNRMARAALSTQIARLSNADPAVRARAASTLYSLGCAAGEQVAREWMRESEFQRLLAGPPTVGIAVEPESFQKIHAAMGSPPLSEVPPDQDAAEFEIHLGNARLDILTTRGEPGAIAGFLSKFGEGIQQVEYPVKDVGRATGVLQHRFGLNPIYPQTREGADGTRVNFFLARSESGKKVLIELVEQPGTEHSTGPMGP